MLLHCVSKRQTDRIVSACLSKRPGRIRAARARPARGRCACFLAKVGIPELLCTEKQRAERQRADKWSPTRPGTALRIAAASLAALHRCWAG
jgi:hypothetical protein